MTNLKNFHIENGGLKIRRFLYLLKNNPYASAVSLGASSAGAASSASTAALASSSAFAFAPCGCPVAAEVSNQCHASYTETSHPFRSFAPLILNPNRTKRR